MIEAIGVRCLILWEGVFALVSLFLETVYELFLQIFCARLRGRECLLQCYSIAVQSLPVVVFSLTFTSLLMILEFSYHMKMVLRQDSLVPAFSTMLMLRELGPVVTCVLLTSRVGASIAAEIATMKVTEQLDALRQLSLDPIEFLIIPRWIASVLAAVCLSVISIGVAILAGASIASVSLNYPVGQFFNTMFVFARFTDFYDCMIKAAVFGTLIPIIACHHGLRCKLGAQAVGNATTAAVVQGTMCIIGSDFILTYLLYAV